MKNSKFYYGFRAVVGAWQGVISPFGFNTIKQNLNPGFQPSSHQKTP